MLFAQGLRNRASRKAGMLSVDTRHAEGDYDRLAAMALEFANTPVAVIMASALPSALAGSQKSDRKNSYSVRQRSRPVEFGLVKSLARPDGNATGVSNFFGYLGGKRLELLRELVSRAPLIAYLLDPKKPEC